MLDVHQMHVFLIAAETLNFSKAALRLHMTQPSVTQHVRSLEDRFGKPLFVRSGHRLALTEAGMALVPLARDLVTMSQRTEEIMETRHGEIQGHLIIGCTTTPGKYLLPSLLASFIKLYPQVSATIQVTNRQHALNLLLQNNINIALTSVFEYHREIEYHKFLTEQVVLIVPLDHPFAGRGVIELDELLEARFIMREETSGTYAVVRDSLAKQGINIADLRRVLTVGNSEAIAFAVQDSLGVAFVSNLVARRFVAGKVARVNVRGLEIYQDIYLLQHWQGAATAVQLAFWQYISDEENEVRKHILSASDPLPTAGD